MSLSIGELKKAMSDKTDEELYDILAHSKDYTEDANEIANEEFRSRKLDAATLSSLGTGMVEEQRQREEAPLSWILSMVAFFFSTLFFGIPVILAHRYFVERGARRKAREWKQWALFGFFFYVALFVLRRYVMPFFN
jgi:hypothetical protein